MATLEQYLDKLKKHRVQYAVEILDKSPPSSDFGYIKGYADGLKKAEMLIDELFRDEKGKDERRNSTFD